MMPTLDMADWCKAGGGASSMPLPFTGLHHNCQRPSFEVSALLSLGASVALAACQGFYLGGYKMLVMTKIDNEISVGPQPTESEIAELQELGFKSVINFRSSDEEDQPLSPSEEGEAVEMLGMAYLHTAISMKTVTPETVDRFREELALLPRPVFAHCKAGRRAALMVMMHLASEAQMPAAEAIKGLEELGFQPGSPETERIVIEYIDSHSNK
jgi:uncharacterized protein (TIGR01244 family)